VAGVLDFIRGRHVVAENSLAAELIAERVLAGLSAVRVHPLFSETASMLLAPASMSW